MIWRVTANLLFDTEDEATDFYHDCELAINKTHTVNPDTLHSEPGVIEYHQCYHDEEPNRPCDLIDQQETD